jgi:riboflavin synthase
MRLSDRIDGHLVSGHIDGIGQIEQRDTQGNAIVVNIEVSQTLARYMIAKGSVAVDGISLTINSCYERGFSVSIIPHTGKLTTIGFKNRGDAVNIETDVIGKYVERFMAGGRDGKPGIVSEKSFIDRELLVKTGFID